MSDLLDAGRTEALDAIESAKLASARAKESASMLAPPSHADDGAVAIRGHLDRLIAIADSLEAGAASIERGPAPLDERVADLTRRSASSIQATLRAEDAEVSRLAGRADADIAAIVEDVRRSFEAAKRIHDALDDEAASSRASSAAGSPGTSFGARLASFRL